MKIAILHFHLNTGGVTNVIKQQVAALQPLGHDVLLLSGQPPPVPMNTAVEVVQGLGYDVEGCQPPSIEQIVSDILKAFGRYGWQQPDVLHVHNPILAKNHQLLGVLDQLQKYGLPLLCQIHDFAEDGRPYAYFKSPYPRDCHYAVINMRDYRILNAAGISDHGLHYLPNAVIPWPADGNRALQSDTTVLYPARAIRRKNIGESILLHYCRHPQLSLAITLPPSSPGDMAAYAMWRALSADQGLNVLFEVGLKSEFKTLTTQCAYALSTSITEGFGFAFLEPWTGGKLLSGRLLPDICEDFLNQGLCLEHLYHHLKIPLAWFDGEALQTLWCRTMEQAVNQYDLDMDETIIASGWQRITSDGLIDFGLLEESTQKQVLEKIFRETPARIQLVTLNPTLETINDLSNFNEMIDYNNKLISEVYSHHRYAQNLDRMYRHVVDTPVNHQIDKKTVARRLLSPETFSLLKWRPFNG